MNCGDGSYAETLVRWSNALAAGRADQLLDEVAVGSSTDVQRFLLNSIVERRRMLTEELALVALACDDFDDLITRYLGDVPRATYDPDKSDSERFLRWLRRNKQLSTQQSDFVAYQEAEYACLVLARNQRPAHVRFQRLLAASLASNIHSETDGNTLVYVNPVRIWSRLAGLSPTPTQRSVEAIFFAAGTQIRVAGLAGQRAAWLRSLDAAEPCPLRVWEAHCPGATASTFASFVHELSKTGLVAVLEEQEIV
jgi:hypothetical protein